MTCTWGTAAGSVSVRGVNACGQSAALSKALTLAVCMEETQGAPVELRTSNFLVYPNPNRGQFTVRSSNAGEFQLLNSIGQVLNVFYLDGSTAQSKEINGLSAGVYFLRSNEDGAFQRIVVME
jgi:hypothetical protein